MKVLIILALIAFILFLLTLIRVGGDVAYGEDGLKVRGRFGRLRLTLWPTKPRTKRKKAKKPPPAPTQPIDQSGTWTQLRAYLPLVAEAAGQAKKKIRIDRLDLDLTVAATDPANAAMAFGAANAAIGMIIPILENNFKIKERGVRTQVDFQRTSTAVSLHAAVSLTVGQGISLGFFLLTRFIKLSSQQKKTQKEAV